MNSDLHYSTNSTSQNSVVDELEIEEDNFKTQEWELLELISKQEQKVIGKWSWTTLEDIEQSEQEAHAWTLLLFNWREQLYHKLWCIVEANNTEIDKTIDACETEGWTELLYLTPEVIQANKMFWELQALWKQTDLLDQEWLETFDRLM